MFDLGWTEMLVIAVVAIVVIGPKDLPKTLRTVGQWMGKARSVAREFQNSIDDMVRESELEEIRKKANSIRNFDADSLLEDDPTGGKPEVKPEPGPEPTPAANVAPPHSLGDAGGETKAEAPSEEGAEPARQTGG